MNKVFVFALLAFLVLAGTVSVIASPFGWGNPEGNDAIRQAIEANDYNAWKDLKIAELTEEMFNAEVERYNEMKAMPEKGRKWFRAGMGQKTPEDIATTQENMKAIEDAITAGNYNAWKIAIESIEKPEKITEKITEETFARYVEMQNALKNGDLETAKTISEELGINAAGMGMRRGRMLPSGGGFHKGCSASG